ncbi:PH domain-containing protein [Agromyces mediolanus]|uniref:Membrane protein n=1 Tax=Agromyces mediolanus TaxID=41986 RepID=A0A918CAI9_AGRME|nr:PH domain-containing protein [Agromyces mediolanus]GGR14316.1 membrane protein [Agromyces mediolanus]GLJ72766.1 membrane protein [Agromyces mediolanus]
MSGAAPAKPVVDLADGEWHRLHPASPLLRGGLVFIAIAGFVIANLRERVVEFFLVVFAPGQLDDGFGEWSDENDWGRDPIGGIVANNLVGWALLAVLLVVVLVIAGFWLSWRMHTFRVTPEAVEVRSGILFRSHRSARLDRIQGINITRPVFARLFGAAKLEVQVAGQSGNMQLAYLGSSLTDGLRRDILRLASGARAKSGPAPAVALPAVASGEAAAEPLPGAAPAAGLAAAPGAAPARIGSRAGAIVGQRVDEFLAPELDPELAPPESVVHIPVGRIVGSTLLGGAAFWMLVVAGVVVAGILTRQLWLLFSFVPAAIGLVSYLWSRITKSLRYSIAGTPDGVRVGYGLLSTANHTIPPGRVHAVEATQWIFWRPFGWWSVRINVAGQSVTNGSEAAQRTQVLPVGTAEDVQRVIALLLPEAAEGGPVAGQIGSGLTGRSGQDGDGFSATPKRGAWLHPFSWRRIGWAAADGIALLRRGSLVRRLVLVPLARMQSVALSAGPVRRGLGLAELRLHTVVGPVVPSLPVIEREAGEALFAHLADEAVERANEDRSQHWGRETADA